MNSSYHHADFCESPSGSSVSSRSMNDNPQDGTATTPPESPPRPPSPYGTGGATATAEGVGRLSLEQDRPQHASHRGRGMLAAASVRLKRSPSSELQKPRRIQSPRQSPRSSPVARGQRTRLHKNLHRTHVQDPRQRSHVPKDSGYISSPPSRYNSQPCGETNLTSGVPVSSHELAADLVAHRTIDPTTAVSQSRYPGLLLQPELTSITRDQLAAEVKGIYAGLVMVEAKCINIDAAQAADPKSDLGPEQWQALIALHRTLLYEHHDFLMATQHPSATPALQVLATKYNMPARMWKHGIHAFLEVLRHRRPHSQDYMLAFIYLAYQSIALLFETVPTFTDTWIECLGDLARYRMAIEEEKETHATWGGVAARWYTMASDKHPAIGRLYHHLGILERPSLRKYSLYAKSLTCVIPFPNARDSLSTLCGPIVQDDQTIQSSRQSAEARIVTYHALNYTGRDQRMVDSIGRDCFELLYQNPAKLRDFGAYLAVTNTASLFELGAPTNALWQLYNAAINQAMQKNSMPSTAPGPPAHSNILSITIPASAPSSSLTSTTSFLIDTFDFVLRHYTSRDAMKDALPYVHVSLVWLHSLHSLRTRLNDGHNTFDIPFDSGRLSWDLLASFLNTLAEGDPITTHALECARQGVFLASERKEDARPLSEDYIIRGLIWTQFYFCPGWFDCQSEDDGRAIQTSAMAKARAERVLFLGLYLAFHTEFLSFDVDNKVFSASVVPRPATTTSAHPPAVEPADVEMEQVSEAVAVTPRSRSSMTNSSRSGSDDGFHIIKRPKTGRSVQQQNSYAKVAAGQNDRLSEAAPAWPKKVKQEYGEFKVANENDEVFDEEYAHRSQMAHPQYVNGK